MFSSKILITEKELNTGISITKGNISDGFSNTTNNINSNMINAVNNNTLNNNNTNASEYFCNILKITEENIKETFYNEDIEEITKKAHLESSKSDNRSINNLLLTSHATNNIDNIKINAVAIMDFDLFVSFEENLSTTDTYKIFRFLPIRRNPMILVLCVPSGTIEDFLLTLSIDTRKSIVFVLILNQFLKASEYFNFRANNTNSNSESSIIRLILYFDNQNSADNFYYEHASKPYYSGSEHLYCCFLEECYIEIISNEELNKISLSNSLSNDDCNKFKLQTLLNEKKHFFIPNKIHLPSCPLCLERMENQISKINTIFMDYQNESWSKFRIYCSICESVNEIISKEESDCIENDKDIKDNIKKYNSNDCIEINEIISINKIEKRDFNKNELFTLTNPNNGIEENNKFNIEEKINCTDINKPILKKKTSHSVEKPNKIKFHKDNKVISPIKKYKSIKNNIACEVCQIDLSIWKCLICGFSGCGRYESGHAVDHFIETNHRFSLLLETKAIWDYIEDSYIHKISLHSQNPNLPNNNNCINNSNDIYPNIMDNECSNKQSKLKSNQSNLTINCYEDLNHLSFNQAPDDKKFNNRLDSIVIEYNTILEEQLEKQRKHYEREINTLQSYNISLMNNQRDIINEKKNELEKMKKQLNSKNMLIKEYVKKQLLIEKQIKEIKENIELTINLREGVNKEIENLNNKENEENKENKEINNETSKKINRNKDDTILNNELDRLERKKKVKEELEKELEDLYKQL